MTALRFAFSNSFMKLTSADTPAFGNAASCTFASSGVAVPNAASATIPRGADASLVRDLKRGGYVLFFRHAMTNWNERDQAQTDFSDRAQQRNLSEAGQREAATIVEVLDRIERLPLEAQMPS